MTQTPSGDGVSEPAWTLLSLAPLPLDLVQAMFESLPVTVVSADTLIDLAAGDLAGVELVLGDWRPSNAGLDAAAVAAMPRLAFLQQPSVGVQAHDGAALAAAGVPLCNVAGFNAAAVTEWTVGAALSVSRLLRWAEDELRAGRWPQTEVAQRGSTELSGRAVGVVGFGPIGQGCARAFGGLGCPVAYWSRQRRPAELEFGARYEADLHALLGGSEILVNAVALGPQTRGLLGRDALALLPRGALVISVSRGGIVDEAAVVDMLASGALYGAAFDVYEQEPLPAGSPLRSAPADRLMLSPHASGNSQQSNVRLIERVVANVGRAVTAVPVEDVVNGAPPTVRRRMVD
jgi:phosphoglycerate dehydrogenase-like enzyme